VLAQRVGGGVDVLGLSSLVDRQRVTQLVGVSFHVRLDALRLIIQLTLHRLEVLQHVRLRLLDVRPIADCRSHSTSVKCAAKRS